MSDVITFFEAQEEVMLASLRELVEIESPSHDKAAVDRMASQVYGQMQAAGATVERFPREGVGDLILGRWEGRANGPPILLLCHMDTVWPLGTVAERPPRMDAATGCFYGPGACDMKGGIVVALTVLQSLGELGLRPVAPVGLLCTGDEEIGSYGSRGVIEELAAVSGLVLCLEPALPGGGVKTARKGGGSYSVQVKGRAAHAGAHHEQGVNAIEEMAHQVLQLQALTDYRRGSTVNVGVIRGGSATNVVPAECEIKVDFRVAERSEAERMQQAFEGLRPHLPGTAVTVSGGLNRPPMRRDRLMARTFEQARLIAARHGIILAEGSSGGGSDGNFTAALGVPTLDGLGVEGGGIHAVDEHVRVSSLPARAALLAALLSEWEFDGAR